MLFKAAHLDGDARACGATTIVVGQNHVRIKGRLWAVENDPNTHGGGGLIAVGENRIRINGKKVILKDDPAYPDSYCGRQNSDPNHCNPYASQASGFNLAR